MHEMIKLSHAVPLKFVFILFYERCWQGGVFKVLKNDFFQNIYAFGSVSPCFWEVKEWLTLQ